MAYGHTGILRLYRFSTPLLMQVKLYLIQIVFEMNILKSTKLNNNNNNNNNKGEKAKWHMILPFFLVKCPIPRKKIALWIRYWETAERSPTNLN